MLVLRDPAPNSSEIGAAYHAIERGEIVLVPTDTVYGLAAAAADEGAVRRLYVAKGRDLSQPTAAVFASVAEALGSFGDGGLSARATWAMETLLPGPWTLIVANPNGRWPWLTGGVAGSPIGVRVPAGAKRLPPIAATSANLAGEPTITRVEQLPAALANVVACAIDVGELGAAGGSTAASTILDLTAWERGEPVRVVRDDAARSGVAIAALLAAPNA